MKTVSTTETFYGVSQWCYKHQQAVHPGMGHLCFTSIGRIYQYIEELGWCQHLECGKAGLSLNYKLLINILQSVNNFKDAIALYFISWGLCNVSYSF